MQKVLSIEIGITTTKICEMDYKKKNPKVYRSIIFDTPDNAIEDGYIRDKNSFADYMRTKLEEAEFKTKNVVFTISSNKILSREVTIPYVKDNRISAVVAAEASEYFPRDITDHIVTYTVLEKRADDKKILLLAFAAPANLVKNYYSFAEHLNLSIVAVDYVGNSSYQWLKRTAITETNFVLQINEDNSIVTIMNNGILSLQRTINYGTNMLAEAVIDSQMFDVDEMTAATELLQKEELLQPRLYMDLDEQEIIDTAGERYLRLLQTKQMITESMQLFISNLARIIEYQATRSHHMNLPSNLKELIITGGGSQIKGLEQLISNELSVPVKQDVNLTRVNLVGEKHIEIERIGELITCLGATIAPVNFVPQDFVVTEQKRDFWKLYAGLLLGTFAASSLLIFVALQNYKIAVNEKERLETGIQDMTYIEEKYANYLSLTEAYQSLEAAEESTFTYEEYFNDLLKELEEKLPSGSLVHSMTSGEGSFSMSVTASSKATAAEVLLQLQKIPYVLEVQVTGLTENKDEVTKAVNVTFSVTCIYQKPAQEEVVQ